MASVIFKITVTLPRRVGWVRFPHSPATSLAATLLCFAPFCPHSAYAQQLDSARVGIATSKSQTSQPTQPDTTKKPPMSPRRAFLTSLLIPGYAQTVFGRDRAAMLFSVIEIGSQEFMCVGANPPFDHPHVFLDLGNDNEIICPYCSTLYRYAADLAAGEARPPECVLKDKIA